MTEQDIKPEVKKPKVDQMLLFAMEIAVGKAEVTVTYCLEEDKFYEYRNGVWQHINEFDLLSYACMNLEKINKHTIASKKQILENLKVIKNIKLEKFNQESLINLENGMFSPEDLAIFPHDEKYYSTMRIPYKYDSEAKCELWLKTLNEILEGDKHKINILQEFFGYCLTKDTRQHKALLLTGESRSGKSTILQTLRSVVGDKNCSSVPLKYISNPQYTPMLINKLVNLDTDVSAKAAEFEAEFKTITSGEPVSCNQKFIAAFEFQPCCKVVMAANIFPKITDHSSAFYKRLILIPCDRVFSDEEQNKNLLSELRVELPGILNWSAQGLKRLRERGRFEDLEFMREAVKELEDENNPVNIFFEEHIVVDLSGNKYIEKSNLYELYKKWCFETNNFTLSKARFASCVFKTYSKSTPKDSRLNNNGSRVWKNLSYIDNKNQQQGQPITWQD